LHDTAIDYLPSVVTVLNQVEPVYEEWEGWQQPTTDCRTYEDLPPAARRYLARIEELVGATAALISVGPERDQVIERMRLF
jgi:adenylosuccinate synthase